MTPEELLGPVISKTKELGKIVDVSLVYSLGYGWTVFAGGHQHVMIGEYWDFASSSYETPEEAIDDILKKMSGDTLQ